MSEKAAKLGMIFAELAPFSLPGSRRQEKVPERNKLSAAGIASLPVGIHSDGDGLYLRVRKHKPKNGGAETVSRQWFFIFRRNGKRTELGLGGYGQGTAQVSLALARDKADAIRHRLAHGEVRAAHE